MQRINPQTAQFNCCLCRFFKFIAVQSRYSHFASKRRTLDCFWVVKCVYQCKPSTPVTPLVGLAMSPAREVNKSLMVASLCGKIRVSLELLHPLGDVLFRRKPLYNQGFLCFRYFYLRIWEAIHAVASV